MRTFPKLGPTLPLTYGVAGKIYTELKYGTNGALAPLTDEHYTWNVMVNGPFGLAAEAINSPERFYFTIPTMAQQEHSAEYQKAVDLSWHPFLGQFPSLMGTYSNNGHRKSILLSEDRRLPFVKLTRGEYLDAVDRAITRAYERDKKILFEAEQGNTERIARFSPPRLPSIRRPSPPALLFDAVSFDLGGQAGPNDQMFVSNIKITKH